MRLAHIMLAKGFGGAERSFVDLVRALGARGHAVLALGEARGEALAALATAPGVSCAAVRCFGTWDRLAEHQLRSELARFAPAVVQAHLARAAHLGGRAAHALGLPTVAKTHNLVNLKYYQHIDCLVPTTRAQQRYLEAHGTPRERIARIPNFSLLAPVDAITLGGARPRRLVALGRLVRKKGFDRLLEACARLAAAGVEFTLELGGDGPERVALERDVARLDLHDRVRLCGWVDDVPAFLRGADVFVLPSRDEPFGIVVLEAMACGVPLVATRTAGPLEILDEHCAVLCADDPEALAHAVQQALEPAGARVRAERALQRFRERYSAAPVVAAYLALYARLAARR